MKFYGRVINLKVVDLDLARTCLTFCHTHHTKLCGLPAARRVSNLKVIDCHTRHIITAVDGEVYLALSYVWGQAPRDAGYAANSHLPDDIPQVVNDAIEVTLKMNYRYLWVDRYCINQANYVEKMGQIVQMDSIYATAQVTIVAAAGQDSNFGLPGLGFRDRRQQPKVVIGDHTLYSTMPDSKLVISKSRWMSRGWTYQEAMLSRRLLVFTEDQIYFECAGMHYCEAISSPLFSEHIADKPRFQSHFHLGLFQRERLNTDELTVWQAISNYSQRKLTYDDDSLNGILGVFKIFEEAKPPIYQLWGIPIFAKPLKWYSRDDSLRVQFKDSHAFMSALLWRHKRPSRRRPKFPSWSWTGWDGAVDIRNRNTPERDHRNPVYFRCYCDSREPVLTLETVSNISLDWKTVLTKVKSHVPLQDLSYFLSVEAWTVKLKFGKNTTGFTKGGWTCEPGYYATSFVGRALATYYGVMEDCSWYAYLSLSREVDDALDYRLQSEEWVGIVLGCTNNRLHRSIDDTILVVDVKGAVAERVGVIDLFWDSVLEGIPQSKDQSRNVVSWTTTIMRSDCKTGINAWKLEKTWRTIRLG